MSIKNDITIISLIFIWCSIFLILTQARNAKPGTCDPNREKYNECGVLPSCEITCNKQTVQPCAKICSPGCFCTKQYMRKYENSTLCVTKKECGNKYK